MKVESINSQTFSAKQRYLSKKSFSDMQKLLTKMNEQTVFTNPTLDRFSSKILSRLYINNKGFFMDCRWLPQKNYLPTAVTRGDSFIRTKNIQVEISNLNGELKILEKPWYRTSKGIARQVGEFITTGLAEFDNEGVVEKRFSRIGGFTEEGLEKFRKNRLR